MIHPASVKIPSTVLAIRLELATAGVASSGTEEKAEEAARNGKRQDYPPGSLQWHAQQEARARQRAGWITSCLTQPIRPPGHAKTLCNTMRPVTNNAVPSVAAARIFRLVSDRPAYETPHGGNKAEHRRPKYRLLESPPKGYSDARCWRTCSLLTARVFQHRKGDRRDRDGADSYRDDNRDGGLRAKNRGRSGKPIAAQLGKATVSADTELLASFSLPNLRDIKRQGHKQPHIPSPARAPPWLDSTTTHAVCGRW